MTGRITIHLSSKEHEALTFMATGALRDPRDQMRWILREEAERRGLWPVATLPENEHTHSYEVIA